MAGVYAFGGWKLTEQAPAMEMPWYTSVGQPWGLAAAAAPELGGTIMWSIAAISLAITAAMAGKRGGQGAQNRQVVQAASAARVPAK
jgi:putative copper resistance protein D